MREILNPEFQDLKGLVRKSLIPFYPIYFALTRRVQLNPLEYALSSATEAFRGLVFIVTLNYALSLLPEKVFSPELYVATILGGTTYGAIGALHILKIYYRSRDKLS